MNMFASCRVYNNHVFVQHNDSRLGANDSIAWDEAPGYKVLNVSNIEGIITAQSKGLPLHVYQADNSTHPTQSLPDFDNPCNRIWARYFAVNASIKSWFTGNHSVSQDVFLDDCNATAKAWRHGIKQIR